MTFPLVRLDECARIVSGATPSTSKAEFWGGDIHWATPADLSKLEGPFINETPRTITMAGLASCAAEILPPQSVLFSSRAPIGHVAINTVPMATNQGFKSFVPSPDRLHAGYLYHWLRSNRLYLERLGNGATFKEVSKAVVSRIEIPLPRLAEQRRIAAILDQAHDVQRKRQEALEKLKSLRRAIFLEMFGDPTKNPRNWPEKKLEEIFHFRTGKLDANAATPAGKFPFFTCSKENFRIDVAAFDCEALLLAGNNASGDYSVKHYRGKFNAYQRTYVITLKDQKDAYEYAQFVLEQRLSELKRISKGTNTKYLTRQLLNKIVVPWPSAELQAEFSRVVSVTNDIKVINSVHLAKLEALFTSLRHRAFRGEL